MKLDIDKPLTEKAANKLAKDLFGPTAYVESVGGSKGVWLAAKPGWFSRNFGTWKLLASSRSDSWEELLNEAIDGHHAYQKNAAIREGKRKAAAVNVKARLESK